MRATRATLLLLMQLQRRFERAGDYRMALRLHGDFLALLRHIYETAP